MFTPDTQELLREVENLRHDNNALRQALYRVVQMHGIDNVCEIDVADYSYETNQRINSFKLYTTVDQKERDGKKVATGGTVRLAWIPVSDVLNKPVPQDPLDKSAVKQADFKYLSSAPIEVGLQKVLDAAIEDFNYKAYRELLTCAWFDVTDMGVTYAVNLERDVKTNKLSLHVYLNGNYSGGGQEVLGMNYGIFRQNRLVEVVRGSIRKFVDELNACKLDNAYTYMAELLAIHNNLN